MHFKQIWQIMSLHIPTLSPVPYDITTTHLLFAERHININVTLHVMTSSLQSSRQAISWQVCVVFFIFIMSRLIHSASAYSFEESDGA